MALTRDQVVAAAVGILTDFGLADLSMRRLARELDVQVGALYWHVKNKQELLVDVAARLLGGIDLPGPAATGVDSGNAAQNADVRTVGTSRADGSATASANEAATSRANGAATAGANGTGAPGADREAGRADVVRVATAIRTALVPIPDSAEVVQLAQSMQPAALRPLIALRDLLETAGIIPARSAWAQHLVLNHVLGSVAAEQDRVQLAAIAAAGDGSVPGGPDLGEDAFAWGLSVILDGALPRTGQPERLASTP